MPSAHFPEEEIIIATDFAKTFGIKAKKKTVRAGRLPVSHELGRVNPWQNHLLCIVFILWSSAAKLPKW
ncbi:MAG: hypothetical protein EBT92_10220 [Planctomycetes bacterium]|nr:hypothetical protein [Planctomycetota bacterium]NBY02969.1 hypothetical protein [Planctomycetota bacterium]